MASQQTLRTKRSMFSLRKLIGWREAKRITPLPSAHMWSAMNDVRQTGLRMA